MTVDPDLPTKDTDLQHAPEVCIGIGAFLAVAFIAIAVSLSDAACVVVAVFCLATRKPWEYK